MGGLWASIRHNLGGLVRFSGRDTRRQFWPYAIFLFLLSMAVSIVAVGFVAAGIMVRLERYIATHPEGLPPPVPGRMPLPAEVMPDWSAMTGPAMAANFVLVLLLAAAIVRRLHDCGRTGLWGLLPLPFLIVGMINQEAAMALAMGQRTLSGTEQLMLIAGPLFWIALVALIVLLAGQGSAGPNRFGADPERPS